MPIRIAFQFSFSAGEEQRHFVENAFNVLVNEGFLRDLQGAQTLEVVQKFYEIINEPMGRATTVKKDLMDFCGKYTLLYQAVITLVYVDSKSNETRFHAVRVSKICVELKFMFKNLFDI